MLAPGEIVTEIDVPVSGAVCRYDKFRLRDSVDFAMVSLASAYELEGGKIKSASLVLGGVAPVPFRREEAELSLIGKKPTEAAAEEAAELALRGGRALREERLQGAGREDPCQGVRAPPEINPKGSPRRGEPLLRRQECRI